MRKEDEPNFYVIDKESSLPLCDETPFPFGPNDPMDHHTQFGPHMGGMQMQMQTQPRYHSMAGAAGMGLGGMNDIHDVGEISSMHGMGGMGSPIMRSQMVPPMGPSMVPPMGSSMGSSMGPSMGPSMRSQMGRISGTNNMMGSVGMGMNAMGDGIEMGMNMNGMNPMRGGGMGMRGMNSMGMSSHSAIMGGMVGPNLHSIRSTGIGTGAFNMEDPILRDNDMDLRRLRQLQQFNMMDQQCADRWTMPGGL